MTQQAPPPKGFRKVLSLWLLFLGIVWILLLSSVLLLIATFFIGGMMISMSPINSALFGLFLVACLTGVSYLFARKYRLARMARQKDETKGSRIN